MEIIEYEVRHKEQLEQVYLNSRRDAFEWMDTSHYQLSDFSKDTQGERIWVAEDAKQVLGFVAIWQADHFIHHLYVDKPVYRRGVGEKLIKMLSGLYEKPLGLKCLCKNERAIQFYYAQGFKTISQGEDSLGKYFFMQLD